MTREEIQTWKREMHAEVDSMAAEARRIHKQALRLEDRWARFETELRRVQQLAKAV